MNRRQLSPVQRQAEAVILKLLLAHEVQQGNPRQHDSRQNAPLLLEAQRTLRRCQAVRLSQTAKVIRRVNGNDSTYL